MANSSSDRDFGRRLKKAFRGDNQATIAEKLGISDASVSAYIKGDSLPSLETFKKISALTNCPLDFLIVGKGEVSTDPLRFLDERVRLLVEKLAASEKIDEEKVVETLLVEALASRGSYLFALYPKLRGRELDQLRLLFELFAEEPGEQADESRVRENAR